MKKRFLVLTVLLVLIMSFSTLVFAGCEKDEETTTIGAPYTFISRGDKSGTHSAEIKIWAAAGVTDITADGFPEGYAGWYKSMGAGMGACLTAANEQNAYVLSDKATFLSFKNNEDGDKVPNLKILKEEDATMKNTYSLLAVNPNATFKDALDNVVTNVQINTKGAEVFIDWMTKASITALINSYGISKYDAQLFYSMEVAKDNTFVLSNDAPASEVERTIRISTTTSVNDSGLLAMLQPIFESETGYILEIASAGTGAAIASAKMGNADLILVHSKAQEEAFVTAGYSKILQGYSAERIPFMYNYFVIAGPNSDPAGVAATTSATAAFLAIKG